MEINKSQLNFKTENIKIVPINTVKPNNYNPKNKNTPEYKKIKKSIYLKGQRLPVIVREKDNGKYEIIDGEQRFTACKELGYKSIIIYNEGKVSDKEAKELTIWYQQQVPFNEIKLAELVTDIVSAGNFELPYSDDEIEEFKETVQFDWNKYQEHSIEILQEAKIPNTKEIYIPKDVYNEVMTIIKKSLKKSQGKDDHNIKLWQIAEQFKLNEQEYTGIMAKVNNIAERKNISKEQALIEIVNKYD